VLIDVLVDNVVMFAFIVIAFVLVVGVLAVVAGADSRIDDVARRRRYQG
jgi:hypothetical protein